MTMTEFVLVGKLEDFSSNELKSFDVEGVEVMGVIVDGTPIVASRICTHKYFDLTKGIYADGYITCTLHTSTFDLEDGAALNPPATDPLLMYPTKVEDGNVYIDIDD